MLLKSKNCQLSFSHVKVRIWHPSKNLLYFFVHEYVVTTLYVESVSQFFFFFLRSREVVNPVLSKTYWKNHIWFHLFFFFLVCVYFKGSP